MLHKPASLEGFADARDIPILVCVGQVHAQVFVELSCLGYLFSLQYTLKEYLRKYPAP
jgi:hypothetical protein